MTNLHPHKMTVTLMNSMMRDTNLHAAYRSCAGSLGLVFAYSCGYNILLLAAPIYLLQIYDRVLSSRSIDTLVMLTLVVSITVVVGGILDAVRRTALGRIGIWLDERTRPIVVAMSLDCAARGDASRPIELYRDVGTITSLLASGAAPVIFDLPWSPVFVGVLFMIHPLLGLAAATSIFTLVILAMIGELATEQHLYRASAASARSYRRLGVAIANIHLLRSMGMVHGAKGMILADSFEAARVQQTAQRRTEIMMLLSKPVRALSQILIMGLAAWLVLQHDKSPAIIFAASLLFGRGLAPIEGALAGWKALSVSVAAYKRIIGAEGPSRVKSIPATLDRNCSQARWLSKTSA